MNLTSVRPSSIIKKLAQVEAQTLNAGSDTTGWTDTKGYAKLAVIVNLGSVAAGSTLVVSAQSSSVVAGTDPKTVNVMGVASYAIADDQDPNTLVLDLADLDAETEQRFVNVTVNNAAAFAAVVGASLVGVGPFLTTGPSPSSVP